MQIISESQEEFVIARSHEWLRRGVGGILAGLASVGFLLLVVLPPLTGYPGLAAFGLVMTVLFFFPLLLGARMAFDTRIGFTINEQLTVKRAFRRPKQLPREDLERTYVVVDRRPLRVYIKDITKSGARRQLLFVREGNQDVTFAEDVAKRISGAPARVVSTKQFSRFGIGSRSGGLRGATSGISEVLSVASSILFWWHSDD